MAWKTGSEQVASCFADRDAVEREVGQILAQQVAGFPGEPFDAVLEGPVRAHIAVLRRVPRVRQHVAEAV